MKTQEQNDCLALKNFPFINFSADEIEKISEYARNNGIETVSRMFVSECADIVGRDIGFAITPMGGIFIIGF